jgi:hypothetical protein
MKYQPIPAPPVDKAYLHFESTRTDPNNVQVDYELVIPLTETDCRGTWDHRGGKRPKSHRRIWLDKKNNRHIPLGRTNVGTSNQDYPFSLRDGVIDLPFRDGAHCLWDNEKLGGLDIVYSTSNGHWLLIPPQNL